MDNEYEALIHLLEKAQQQIAVGQTLAWASTALVNRNTCCWTLAASRCTIGAVVGTGTGFRVVE